MTTTPDRRALTFDAFYRVEADAAMQLAWLLTRDQEQSGDVAQEAFTVVWQRWEQLNNPRAYLRTCIVNGVRRAARTRDRARRREVQSIAGSSHISPAPQEPLDDSIAVLPLNQRTAVVLRYWADLSDNEIADVLGVRQATVRSLVHRALATLRRTITP